jgi:WD40 repeat protein
VIAVAVSRDGRWLVTAGKEAPIVWDATPLRRLVTHGHRGELAGLAFTRDGKQFVSGARDHTVRLWDVATARELVRISTGTTDCSDGVIALDGGDVASACDDGTLRRWDRDGHARELTTNGWLRITALSPDHTQIAAAHVGGRLALVDVASWRIVAEKVLHAHNIYDVKYAHDGRIVTASLDDHVRVWHAPDLGLDLDVRAETDNGVLAAALSPDGKQLAIGTQETGSVEVWDVAAGRWLVRDLGDRKLGVVWKLVYTPDGSRVLTASDDGVIRIWDAKTWGAPTLLDASEGPGLALAVSPDGKRALAGYRSGAIVIWNLETQTMQARIGGRTRDGTCSEASTQAWSDDTHRSIVLAACASDAATYFKRLSAHSHQTLANEVDVTWDWLRGSH